jgi:hypothetical protein
MPAASRHASPSCSSKGTPGLRGRTGSTRQVVLEISFVTARRALRLICPELRQLPAIARSGRTARRSRPSLMAGRRGSIWSVALPQLKAFANGRKGLTCRTASASVGTRLCKPAHTGLHRRGWERSALSSLFSLLRKPERSGCRATAVAI